MFGPLAFIFNNPGGASEVPVDWKRCKCVPVFKKRQGWKYLTSIPDQIMEKMTRDSCMTKVKETEHQCQLAVLYGKQVSFNFLVSL